MLDADGDPTIPRQAAQPLIVTMTRRELRLRKVAGFVIAFTRDRGYPPTVRETGHRFNLGSSRTIHNLLIDAAHLGVLERRRGSVSARCYGPPP